MPAPFNSPSRDFDPAFSRDGHGGAGRMDLFTARRQGRINTPSSSTYAPMLDWSDTDRVTFTTRRPADNPRGADLYRATIRVR